MMKFLSMCAVTICLLAGCDPAQDEDVTDASVLDSTPQSHDGSPAMPEATDYGHVGVDATRVDSLDVSVVSDERAPVDAQNASDADTQSSDGQAVDALHLMDSAMVVDAALPQPVDAQPVTDVEMVVDVALPEPDDASPLVDSEVVVDAAEAQSVDAGFAVDAEMMNDVAPPDPMDAAPDPMDAAPDPMDAALDPMDAESVQDVLLAMDAVPEEPEDAEFIYDECGDACCPGFQWRRPGGFWTDLAGHTPDWRPELPNRCIFGIDRDGCARVIRYTTGRDDCPRDQCDQCELNLNEYRLQRTYVYDERGHVTQEAIREMRHIDFSNDIIIRHTYDARGLRIETSGRDLPDEGRPRSVFLRYTHDDTGRLIREEAIHERFRDFDPVPWEPDRISTFTHFEDRVEEGVDDNADGIVDRVLEHPL